MTLPLVSGPLSAASLLATMNTIIAEINAAGIGSAVLPALRGPLDPGALEAALNGLAVSVNAVTAPGSVSPYRVPCPEADMLSLLNRQIRQINLISPSYHASAVRFDGSTWLSTNAISCVDNSVLQFSGWFQLEAATPGLSLFYADPNNFLTGMLSEYFGNPGSGAPGVLEFMLGKVSGDPGGYQQFGVDTADVGVNTNWHHLLCAAQGDSSGQYGGMRFYYDDVDVTPPRPSQAALAAGISADVNTFFTGQSAVATADINGLPFFVGGDSFGDNLIGSAADLRIQCGGTSWLTGSGATANLTLATRRLFINGSGKPVNPSVATAALGAPTVLFSGDASSFGANQGTGGAFATTGALTNASTSPSD